MPYQAMVSAYQELYLRLLSDRYKKAIELDPGNAIPHDSLGSAYYYQKKYDEAIAEFKKAIELDPSFADPHDGLGDVYLDQKEYEAAILKYKQAIALNPDYAKAHYNLCWAYKYQDDKEWLNLAQPECQKACEIDKQYCDFPKPY